MFGDVCVSLRPASNKLEVGGSGEVVVEEARMTCRTMASTTRCVSNTSKCLAQCNVYAVGLFVFGW